MADFIVDYHVPIEDITDKWRLGLTAYTLDNHEWELLGQLHDVLKILKDATLYFSRGTLNLAMVIPVMDYINEKFTNYLLMKDTLDPEI
ncbi:hypothetical protein SCLCIDRAFT_30352 [Scleroderma citrinum Foug A]|uniref:Uncharacterized protein n=1 Tax=Scleroderma citrinum Foug A TaxID=1036808 RepID=A0A0C3DHE7_9AGAM|nr:hypothetical protein SCLCIDRAFT_30352 [Scleroderma citrinum Foug A]